VGGPWRPRGCATAGDSAGTPAAVDAVADAVGLEVVVGVVVGVVVDVAVAVAVGLEVGVGVVVVVAVDVAVGVGVAGVVVVGVGVAGRKRINHPEFGGHIHRTGYMYMHRVGTSRPRRAKMEHIKVGETVYIETGRWGYIGVVTEVDHRFVVLQPCCRIMETGPWSRWEMGEIANAEYVLPFRSPRCVAIGHIMDMGIWAGTVPSWAP